MKRLSIVISALLLAAPLVCAQDQGVSLGDAARAQQAKKSHPSPNAKVYDNENLPKGGNISTTTGDYAGVATAPASKNAASAAAAKAGDTAATGKAGDKGAKDPSAEEAAKAQADEYQQKVNDAKKAIADLQHEIDILQREQRLQAAAYYGDAAARLQNTAQWEADVKKQQETLKAKQDQLDAAKAALDQVRDDIRKAGLPSTIGE
ncbi:MAG: hypothetical protein HYX28_01050 [Candidatus Koribacter versatilis]|uniref:Uncharacterized protein n=1 Tax=Candidatus Korobacter versatilis TaxID=658062 RepID=A0A932A613_9BACT|nr:hypothetical protein [Candidatus Koribacter versatilis]